MWELIIGAILVVGVLLGGGWLICCHAKFYQQWSEMVRKQIQGVKDAWDRLPGCPGPPRPPVADADCPPMPPVKKPRETWVFPKGMNYSTCARAMKVEPLSLETIADVCRAVPDLLTSSVIITTKAGRDLLAAALPPKPKTPRNTSFSSVPFYGVPVKVYDDEGMARAAVIVAEADGYEVMLFLPDKGWEVREDAVGQPHPKKATSV